MSKAKRIELIQQVRNSTPSALADYDRILDHVIGSGCRHAAKQLRRL